MSQKLQRYKLGDKIGQGAMGEVYQAYDTQTERNVAIKMLSAQSLHGQRLQRFRREARTIARLEHPFVVPLYDFSLPEGDEPPYLVMRYMTGGTLADKIRQGRLPADEVYQIIRRIASALDAAHDRGLVHRDLKPGNILLDQDGYAYLADFGIVKDTEAEESLTHGGQLGTSLYMSPEQILGDDLDHRSDIYALGVVAFEMLTGRPPFTGNMHTIFQGHLNEDVPRVYAFADGIPDEVDDVLRKAMAKKPTDRYTRASQMAKALEAALQSPSTYQRLQSVMDAMPEEFEFKPLDEVDSEVPDTVPSPALPDTVATPGVFRRWQILAGGLAVVLLVVVALFVGNMLGQANQRTAQDDLPAVQSTNESPTDTPRPATPLANAILVLRQDASAIWQNGDNLEQLPENGRIPFRNPILFQSGQGHVELLLPNFVRIILDTNTTLRVETAVENGETILELQRGRVLVKSDLPVHIYHASGYEADLLIGAVGVEVNQAATDWEVDCLMGMCLLGQAEGEEPVELVEGQSARLSEDVDLIPAVTQLSRFEAYNNLDASIILPTPTSTTTSTATRTPSPTATPTITGTPTDTPPSDLRGPEVIVLGQSAGGKNIEVVRFGNGPDVVLMVGGIHYGYAPNSVLLTEQLVKYFGDTLTAVPENITLYIVPNLSPDADYAPGELRGRLNENGVDLNRNWDCRWQRDAEIFSTPVPGSGGPTVFSEPAVQLLKAFIEQTEPRATVFWGAGRRTNGLVSPGACQTISLVSVPLVQYYAEAADYEYVANSEVSATETLTGDVTNWLDNQGIPSIFIIMPGFIELDFNRELSGVLSVLSAVAEPRRLQQTPTPVSCGINPAPVWLSIFDENRFRLGCAANEMVSPMLVWQQFANGRILWREDTDQVYVLYNDNSIETFLVDDPALADFHVSALIKGAIGYVYSSNSAVATKLGNPSDEEKQAADVMIQDFLKGFIISWRDGTERTHIVLLEANQWQNP